jgi:hypothetical protein
MRKAELDQVSAADSARLSSSLSSNLQEASPALVNHLVLSPRCCHGSDFGGFGVYLTALLHSCFLLELQVMSRDLIIK